jgi:hypothetical protein
VTEEHKAQIQWSSTLISHGLPDITETIDPAWFEYPDGAESEGWSLVCAFASPPSAQGSPSVAQVHFMVPGAPHDRLSPGTVLYLFERRTARYATVTILD